MLTPAFAITDGGSSRYTSSKIDEGSTIFNVEGNRGYCVDPGVPAASSGTATARKLSNNSTTAKVLFFFIKEEWDKKAPSSESPYVNLDWNTVMESMMQYSYNPTRAEEHWRDSLDWGDGSVNTLKGLVARAEALDVPDNFEAYYMNAGSGNQNFAVGVYAPTGPIKIKKSSANPGITG